MYRSFFHAIMEVASVNDPTETTGGSGDRDGEDNMKYHKIIKLRDGRECILRNGEASDAEAALANFILTHEQTDYLLTYPDENTMAVEQEGQFLQEKTDSETEVEILAEVDGVVAGLAGIESVGGRDKIRHRAEFGISIDRRLFYAPEFLSRYNDSSTMRLLLRCTVKPVSWNSAGIQEASDPGLQVIRSWFTCGWNCKRRTNEQKSRSDG